MKRFILFIFIFILFKTQIITAQDFLQKTYYFGQDVEALKIKEIESGNYIMIAILDSNILIIEIDNNGNITETNTFDEFNYNLLDIDITANNETVIFYSIPEDQQNKFYAAKIDAQLNVLWITYLTSEAINHPQIIATSQSRTLLAYNIGTTRTLVYLKENGEIDWNKNYKIQSSFYGKFPLLELSDGNFLTSTAKSIIKYNQLGDSLWTYNVENNIFELNSFNQDGSILIGASNLLLKIDNNGNKIYESILSTNTINTLRIFDDGYSIVSTPIKFYIFNQQLELIQERNTKFNFADTKTNGDVFYSIGNITIENRKYLTFYRDNKNDLQSKFISLVSPSGGEVLPIEDIFNRSSSHFTIKWYTENINKIRIEFSPDNGNNWEELDTTSLVSENQIWLNLPLVKSDQCLIRISDFQDSNFYDQSDSVFSIRYYRYNDFIAGNECFMYIGNNGMSSHDPLTDGSGFYWPGGKDATIPAIFADGILWGGLHDGTIKVNGATYRYGLKAGAILEDGTADDFTKDEYSIFKLKKDWELLPEGREKDYFKYQYENWPAEHGAPYIDNDKDGKFTKGIDSPEILGDETLFYVSNDLDESRTTFTYGSLPIGIEFQQTLFAYNTTELKNVIFKRVKIINKSDKQIDSMYIAYWADDDLGFAGDDFVGCDTLLNLAFTYNGDNYDEDYYGSAPPSVGRLLLQGPIVKGESTDSAKFNNKFINGFKNLAMTSSNLYIGGLSQYRDPALGVYDGSLQLYNQMSGKLWNGGSIINPITGNTTMFILSGDPIAKTGWYEGEGWAGGPSAGDRRSLMSSGPFTMAPGDTQDVAYAIFMARGSDNIQSIEELKKSATIIQHFWDHDIYTDIKYINTKLPDKFVLYQNYPNPFNPTTTIKYSIPSKASAVGSVTSDFSLSKVTLTIYDILGREVATLISGEQSVGDGPGTYEVEWNAKNFSSGVYYYQLRFNNFISTKKMIVLK